MHGLSHLRLRALDFNNLTAVVVPTIGAYTVRKMFITAVCAGDEMAGLKCVMRSPSVAPSFRDLPLRKGWHLVSSLMRFS